MKKIVLVLMLCNFCLLSFSKKTTATQKVTVHFKVDLSAEMSKISRTTVVGIRGNVAPLSWDKTFPLSDEDKDGKYEGDITFSINPGARILYKFMLDDNWERTANRALVIGKDSVLKVNDKWEYLVAERSAAYYDSIELKKLPATIFALDSLLFDSYNRCQLDIHASLFSEDIEFYHDRGGLSTSKSQLIEAVRNNICNKVQRELKPGSLEVSPIPGYGAVCIGMHRFHNLVEKSVSQYSKFVTVWQFKDGQWKVTRVISLH